MFFQIHFSVESKIKQLTAAQHNTALEITFVAEAGLLGDTCICKPITASEPCFFRDPFGSRISGSLWKLLKCTAFKHGCHIPLNGVLSRSLPCARLCTLTLEWN